MSSFSDFIMKSSQFREAPTENTTGADTEKHARRAGQPSATPETIY
jgi:hypothetical protein